MIKEEISILIVEDEVLIAEFLKATLFHDGYRKVEMVHEEQRALRLIKNCDYDLIFLDIRLGKNMGGLDLASHLHNYGHPPFIFITAQSDPEIMEKALQTHPDSFITKPFKKADVLAAASLALQRNNESKTLVVKDGWSKLKIPLRDILYAQSDGNYIQLCTISKKFLLRYTLDWFMEQVNGNDFFRIHRKIVVNLNAVEKLESSTVVLRDEQLPVSRSRLSDFKNVWGN